MPWLGNEGQHDGDFLIASPSKSLVSAAFKDKNNLMYHQEKKENWLNVIKINNYRFNSRQTSIRSVHALDEHQTIN